MSWVRGNVLQLPGAGISRQNLKQMWNPQGWDVFSKRRNSSLRRHVVKKRVSSQKNEKEGRLRAWEPWAIGEAPGKVLRTTMKAGSTSSTGAELSQGSLSTCPIKALWWLSPSARLTACGLCEDHYSSDHIGLVWIRGQNILPYQPLLLHLEIISSTLVTLRLGSKVLYTANRAFPLMMCSASSLVSYSYHLSSLLLIGSGYDSSVNIQKPSYRLPSYSQWFSSKCKHFCIH